MSDLSAAIKCLDAISRQAKFPSNAAAADACHQKALDAVAAASSVAASLDIYRQAQTASLGALQDGVMNRQAAPGSAEAAHNRQQAAQIASLKTSVNESLGSAAERLRGLDPVQKVYSDAKKKAPALAKAAQLAMKQLELTRSWSGSGVIAAGADLDALNSSLKTAFNSLERASREWQTVAVSPTTELIISASRDAVAALGGMNAADKALDKLASQASGTAKKPVSLSGAACASLAKNG